MLTSPDVKDTERTFKSLVTLLAPGATSLHNSSWESEIILGQMGRNSPNILKGREFPNVLRFLCANFCREYFLSTSILQTPLQRPYFPWNLFQGLNRAGLTCLTTSDSHQTLPRCARQGWFIHFPALPHPWALCQTCFIKILWNFTTKSTALSDCSKLRYRPTRDL